MSDNSCYGSGGLGLLKWWIKGGHGKKTAVDARWTYDVQGSRRLSLQGNRTVMRR